MPENLAGDPMKSIIFALCGHCNKGLVYHKKIWGIKINCLTVLRFHSIMFPNPGFDKMLDSETADGNNPLHLSPG